MHTAIVGAGPIGLFTAVALARRGRRVTVVDRDPGPPLTGDWNRRGVMQFQHAHAFRGPVADALSDEMPDVLQRLGDAGAEITMGDDGRAAALLCRRSTFEAVLRAAARRESRIEMIVGHVDAAIVERGRAVGLQVAERRVRADLALDVSGRKSRWTDSFRPPAEGGDCGASYVTRHYRLRPDATAAQCNSPTGLSLAMDGYWAIVFRQDARTFAVMLSHDGTDKRLRNLRHDAVFDTAVSAIPGIADWAARERSTPISPVLVGGRLYNTYRGQLDARGRPSLPGVISLGDAVCTTTPLAGRGVTLGLWQARRLLRLLDDGHDIDSATGVFDHWCRTRIRPWFDDHRHADADRLRRWSGGDIDVHRRLPSDLIVAAAEADPRLRVHTDPFSRMDAPPTSLSAAEPRAREIYRTGWRPAVPVGPTRGELADLCATDLPGAA